MMGCFLKYITFHSFEVYIRTKKELNMSFRDINTKKVLNMSFRDINTKKGIKYEF